MLVHLRVTPSIKFTGTQLYTWVERGTVRVKCLAQENNTMAPARPRTWTVVCANHEGTAPSRDEWLSLYMVRMALYLFGYYIFILFYQSSYEKTFPLRWNPGLLKQFCSTCTQIDCTSRWIRLTTVSDWRANANWNISNHNWKSDSAVSNCLVRRGVFAYLSSVKGATSRFAHFEKFSLNLSSSSFVILLSLLHS